VVGLPDEADLAELELDVMPEEVTEELIIEVAIEWLRVDDAVMVLFIPTLFLISRELD
jgi:hypothetical protein